MAGSMEARTVGYGFKPTEEQLFGHFLKKKLKGELEANCPIPDLNIYDWEPSQLFFIYDLLSSEPSDGRGYYFFCPRVRKRKTKCGFWKETSSRRVIRAPDGKPMRTKRYLVYHEGRQPKGRRTEVAMHEYHLNSDVSDSEISDPTAWVLCHIIKRESKKAKSTIASASTDLSSHLSSAQAIPGVTIESDYPTETLNTGLPDWNAAIPDQQPQMSKEQHSCYDDKWHIDGPSDGRWYIPNSLSDGIDITDLLDSDESTGQTQICKEKHLADDDNWHAGGPSDPSDCIYLEDLSDKSKD
ncbi:hypothetical protein BT93_I0038 [Corymbia citriodora subsp. variegata]|nr:hypothetical protein BT93_I0038 [Corymbia citriodora subsp. variegata]